MTVHQPNPSTFKTVNSKPQLQSEKKRRVKFKKNSNKKQKIEKPAIPPELTTCHRQQLQLSSEGKSNKDKISIKERSRGNKPCVFKTRSGRILCPRDRLMEAMTKELENLEFQGEIFFYKALCLEAEHIGNLEPIMSYKASTDPDTIYMHQAMK